MYKVVIEVLEHIDRDLFRLAQKDDAVAKNLIAESHALREAVRALRIEPTNETRQLVTRLAIAFNKPIENLNLSIRTYNALKRWGIYTIGDLYEARLNGQLPKVRNLGNKSMLEIEKYLDEYVDSVIQEARHEEQ